MTALQRRFSIASAIGVLIFGSGCGGSGDEAQVAARPASACADLLSRQITEARIGLPTRGAVVTSAKSIPASGTGTRSVVEHCLVAGSIRPVDAAAPDIKFQVALPTSWNSKAMMLGGAGYNGTIPDVSGSLFFAPASAVTALARGYAVFASDSGHQSTGVNGLTPAVDASSFVNQEAYRNWTGDALKKTRDSALELITAVYGRTPAKAYFFGASTGGKEALIAAGRWPQDWDGIVSFFPARETMSYFLPYAVYLRAFAAPGAFPSYAKRGVLYRAALAACDSLDGVADKLISNVQRCNATFDPATALFNGVPVRCPGGADTGDTCLSDAQIGAYRTMNSPVKFPFVLASGRASFPGFNAFISDTGGAPTSPLNTAMAEVSIGNAPPASPATPGTSLASQLTDGGWRYTLTGNPAFNFLTEDLSPYHSRVVSLSALDIGDNDLTEFATRGGKALMMHGTEDMLISPRATQEYFQSLQARMGVNVVESFMRFYEVPGTGHGVGNAFSVSWDALSALENWVEKSVDPAQTQVITDAVGVAGRTRPLCRYPAFPKYKGTGDVNLAASFTCAVD